MSQSKFRAEVYGLQVTGLGLNEALLILIQEASAQNKNKIVQSLQQAPFYLGNTWSSKSAAANRNAIASS